MLMFGRNDAAATDDVNNAAVIFDEEKVEAQEQFEHGPIDSLAIPDYRPGTDEEKRLVRKIDLFLLPTIFLMYFLSYLDRIK